VSAALRTAAALVAAAWMAGCGGGDARFPKRPEGCDVKVFPSTPDVPTENIGPVVARCDEDVPAADCLRTLKDQVCKMGGDVVWGVEEPTKDLGKVRYDGRAARTKAPKAK
jgi:hypothetical protein